MHPRRSVLAPLGAGCVLITSLSPSLRADLRDGLLAHYPLNGNPADATENGNDLINENVTWSSEHGGSAYFDGSATLYRNPAPGVQPTESLSVAFWCKMSSTVPPSKASAILYTYHYGGYGIFHEYGQQTIRTAVTGSGGGPHAGNDSVDFPFDRWFHVTMTYDKSMLRFYVDGTEVESSPAAFSLGQGASGIVLGGKHDHLGRAPEFAGHLDDVMIWDRSLSADEISELLTTTGGLVLHYPLDIDAQDHSGYANHGTWTGGSYQSGVRGQATSFAPGDYLSAGGGSELNTMEQLTLSCWFRVDTEPVDNEYILGKGADDFDGQPAFYRLLYTQADHSVHFDITQSGPATPLYKVRTGANSVQLSTWYHLAGVYDGSTAKMYLDGVLVDEVSAPAGPLVINPADPLYVNRHDWSGQWSSRLTGQIDSVRVFRRALSDSQVALLMDLDAEDLDQDGVYDAYETGTGTYDSPKNTGTDPNLPDSDSDGFVDGLEISYGSDPTSAASTLEGTAWIQTAVEFEFFAASGASYRIEGSIDAQDWTTIEITIPGNGGIISRLYSTVNQDKRFFRVVRE